MGASAQNIAGTRISDGQNIRFEKLSALEREFDTKGQARLAIGRGELPAYRIGRRWIRVQRTDFVSWLESKRVPADRTDDCPSIGIGDAS